MLSRFFIERPVLSNVIALVTMLLGAVAILKLPVSQYPPITPPTVQVTANYPGASAQTMVDTVALPIEQQVNGVENMLYMNSTSTSDGRYTLTVTFEVGTDLDFAQVLVQNRVSAAMAQLPQSVQQQGVVTQKKSTAILQFVALTSTSRDHDALFLSNYGTLQLRDRLARLPGVGQVQIMGVGDYGMRVWLDPTLLQQRSLTPSDVINAIQRENAHVAAGQLGMPPAPQGQEFQLTVNVEGALATEDEFGRIIVKAAGDGGGQITRLKDVGRVELGARSYSQFFKLDDEAAGGIAIFVLPEANSLATAAAVRTEMEKLARDFPPGMKYEIPFDTTLFVSESIREVYATLFEAGILVLVVIVVFLQNLRATAVPATTVPVTIIGAFAAMAAMGFSVNLLTLFGVVLAIGIVVDDAIVVVEGATQHIERGKTPKDASIAAMGELLGPIVGITLVLMSVFLPPAFMPGITGQMYRQFALVIAATALISAINAATLKPTQCAMWLKPVDPGARKNVFFRGFNRVYDRSERAYVRLVTAMVGRSRTMVVIALVLIGIAGWGFTRVPTGFIPTEDQGYVIAVVQLPDGASLQRTETAMSEITGEIMKVPGVLKTVQLGGVSALEQNASLSSAGVIYVTLKPWHERGNGQDLLSIYTAMSNRLDAYQHATARVLVPPPIQGLGLSGGFSMQLELTDGTLDYPRLQKAADDVIREASNDPAIRLALTPFRSAVPQLVVSVDRTQAETLNVAVGDVFNTLQSYVGSSFVNLFTRFGHTYMVYVQADAQHRLAQQDLDGYYVRSQTGAMVPLGTLATIEPTFGPSVISLYNLFPTAAIVGASNPGYSSGEALDVMRRIADRTLPPGVHYEWTAMSYQEQLVGSSAYWIFALAILLVYFVLAGQYESWITPGAVIFAVPLALLGTVVALLGTGVANNTYVQIGLVLLIALSAKNAILIVEMARERIAEGHGVTDATIEACRVRFRPILMTSFTFILGVLPLLLASGAGASARKSLGLAVISGMLTSTCLAILFVPAFNVVLLTWAERRRARRSELAPPPTPAV
ncbi:MAG: efflux RND transporter permease subunit [Rhodanobacteraceae bacterium]